MLTQPFSMPTTNEAHLLDEELAQNEQIEIHYAALKELATSFLKNQYLHSLLDKNEVLFYRLIQNYLKELLPVLYTPTVSEVVQAFNEIPKRARGLYIDWPHRDQLETLLAPYAASQLSIAILTDGERILGLGDQGVGGIEICMAKAMMYVICAQIAPHRILPIYLDVGTNNSDLLKNPHYKGWRHPRLGQADYDAFVEKVVIALKKKSPHLYLHWEDLERDNANRLLQHYQKEGCTFNDDIQGTGVVALASALNAIKITNISIKEQRIVIFGGGAAGIGIANQLSQAMQRAGLTESKARSNIWLIGRYGLLFTDSSNLTTLQRPYARPEKERIYYDQMNAHQTFDLLCVVKHVKPTFLIGCSGKAGAFTEEVVTTMSKYAKRPIIFPLSNPTSYCEAVPQDLLKWSQNKALIATGSPFEDVVVEGKKWPISQCNNALVFPGIGLGVQVSQARQLTKEMLWQACLALCEATPPSDEYPILLPNMVDIHRVTEKIADAVYKTVQESQPVENRTSEADRIKHIRTQYWSPLSEPKY